MLRAVYSNHLKRADALVNEVIANAPATSPRTDEFRADLAGMLCVSCVAQYENAIKEILVHHASRQHAPFGIFVERNFKKLNSKIERSDLEKYAALYGDLFKDVLKSEIDRSDGAFQRRTRTSPKEAYTNMLRWRHMFAHSGQRCCTLEEVANGHSLSKRVIHCFSRCFS